MNSKSPAYAASAFSVDRLASLSDGVFAVAMTLLIYNVHLPRGPLDDAQLRVQLDGLARNLQALLSSFAVAAMFWRGHIKLLEVMRQSSRPHVTIALAFLIFVILLPLTTDLYGTFGTTKTTAPLYAGNLAVLAVSQLSLWVLTVAGLPLSQRTRLLYLTPSIFVSLIFIAATPDFLLPSHRCPEVVYRCLRVAFHVAFRLAT